MRAEGDPVRLGDQVVFESIKTHGQYLHVSLLTHPETEPDVGCCEVNLSVTQSAFTILGHRSHEDTKATALRGGDVIQLFHKEISAYVCAEGLYVREAPIENVHLRKRTFDTAKPHSLLPPTSGVGYWQVEFAAFPLSGNPIPWESAIRLKHVSTKMYLYFSANSSGQYIAGLTSDRRMDTVFSIVAVAKNGDNVEMDSYARLQHRQTGI